MSVTVDREMTAREITDILVREYWRSNKNTVISNFTNLRGLPGEADLFVVRPSGFADDCEIKISAADFRCEFRESTKTVEAKAFKHRALVNGIPDHLYKRALPDWNRTTPHVVRRYWIAMPASIAYTLAKEAPDYAGILAVHPAIRKGFGDVVEVRRAKEFKNARKVTAEELSAIKAAFYYRYWNTRLHWDKSPSDAAIEAGG